MQNYQNFGEQLIEAFEKLNILIYKYIYVRTGFSKELAQDLTQDVFERAWKARATYDTSKASLKSWLFIIARNRVVDYYRTKKNIVQFEEKYLGVQDDKCIEENILYENILSKMQILPDKEKELITLYYISELDIKEIAKIIKKKYTATKISIYRALDKLKELINAEGN